MLMLSLSDSGTLVLALPVPIDTRARGFASKCTCLCSGVVGLIIKIAKKSDIDESLTLRCRRTRMRT